MIKLLYTIAEISEELGYSKVTIYNRVNSLKGDLRGCIKHKKGVMYITDEGLLIIKKDLGLIPDEDTLNSDDEFKAENIDNNEDLNHFKDINYLVETIKKTVETSQENYINSLLEQIELLKSELNKKDEQLNNTLRLLENSQILIRDNKEKILELESQEQKEKNGLFNWFRK